MDDRNHVLQECSITVDNLQIKILLGDNNITNEPSTDTLVILTPHTHLYAELFICRKDKILINTPDGIRILSANETMIIPPGIPHCCITETNNEIWMALPFTGSKIAADSNLNLYRLFSPCIAGDEILYFRNCDMLIENIETIISSLEKRKKSSLLHFVCLLTNLLEQWEEEVRKENRDTISRDNEMVRLNRLDWFINNGFMMNCSAERIAEALFISSRQLSRIVYKRYGKTLYQLIIEKRLKTAEQLLINTDMNTEKIAHTIGFGSRSSFFREFRKENGMTPTEYRNQKKKDDKNTHPIPKNNVQDS